MSINTISAYEKKKWFQVETSKASLWEETFLSIIQGQLREEESAYVE